MDKFVTGVDVYLRSGLLPLYYAVSLILAIYILYRFKFEAIALFIVMLYWEGFFIYVGQFIPFINYIYKVGFAIITAWLFGKQVFVKPTQKEFIFNFVFIFLGILYLLTVLVNDSDISLAASQYIKKYGIPFMFYYGMRKYINNTIQLYWIAKIFLWVLGVQAFMSVVKLFLFGFGESLVGTVSFSGGGPSNVLPIVGFFIILLYKGGNLEKKDWLFVISLLLISVIGNKRSIILIFPIIVMTTMIYVKRGVTFLAILKYIPLGIILLVVGVKLNPSLNPDGSRWGHFDFDFLYNYAYSYTFGNEDSNEEGGMEQGKGGGLNVIFDQTRNDIFSREFFFGNGLNDIIYASYDTFNTDEYGLTNKGAMGAALQNFFTLGIIGLLVCGLFSLSFANLIRHKNLKIIISFFLLWDYFLFYNSSIVINAHGITFAFIIIFANAVLGSSEFRKV